MVFDSDKMPRERIKEAGSGFLAELQCLRSAGRATIKQVCPPLSVKVFVFVCLNS